MEKRVSLTAVASPAAFALLAAVLASIGAIPRSEAVFAVVAIALAFVSTGWWAGAGVRRRLAEASLVPAAFAMTMVGSGTMLRMVLPPLLLLAIWAVVASAWDRVPTRHRPLLAAIVGLAARVATGPGLSGFGALPLALSFAVAVTLPWMAARRWGRRAAELAALVGAVLPWQSWPLIAGLIVVAAVAAGAIGGRQTRDALVHGWMPGVGAAALLVAALSAWPGLSVGQLFPEHGWLARLVVLAALAITPALRPGVAGVVWLAATLCLGPLQGPSPEQRAFVLTEEHGELSMSAGNGRDYVVDIDIDSADRPVNNAPIVVLRFAGTDNVIFAESSDRGTVWRPHGVGSDTRWRAAGRIHFVVPHGERPILFRHHGLPADVAVRVETIGAVTPTPPRDWAMPTWLLAGAAAVLAIEIFSGTWRAGIGALPWVFLVLGSLVARAPVEPLRLLGERLAVDFALAALLAAWLPAARVWLGRRRVFVTVAAVLVPLALATPHLSPPLYGDEPFHLLVMDSLREDQDLDIADDLDLEHHPQNHLYAPGRPLFHSPVLGILLFPGFVVAGRTGALVLLALVGAGFAVLIARRARDFGVRQSAVGLLMVVLASTYPVATFATQIWPELVGALAVAALLVLAALPRGGGVPALVVAVTAAAVKTRLGLLTLPIAAAIWLRRRPLRGLLVLAIAGGTILAVGWLTMGHPFGPYRRLHHLVPSHPGLVAKVFGGLFFDAAGGLAFTAPLWLAALAGMGLLWRRGGPGERAMLIGCAFTAAALLHSSEWYGGGSPPARYLVPMLPAFALAGVMVVASPSRWRRLLVVLLPPSVVAWWVLVTRPHLSVNPGDGGYWLADALARRFAADGRSLFPSFLVVDSASVMVPVVIVALMLLAVWATRRSPGVVCALGRCWIALWLAAAAALVLTLNLRPDRVVEAESPQVRKSGGSPVPAAGTVSRYSHRRGWRLDNGDRLTVPLNIREDSEVILEGWLLGTARKRAQVELRWDEEAPVVVDWSGHGATERLRVPSPPERGRHRLSISLCSSANGAVVLDRLIVVPAGA